MKFKYTFVVVILLLAFGVFAHSTEARARYGSTRIGGYTSHGKGCHYVGGYVRSTHILKYYSKHK